MRYPVTIMLIAILGFVTFLSKLKLEEAQFANRHINESAKLSHFGWRN